MSKEDLEKVNLASVKINEEMVEQLKEILPGTFVDGKIDLNKLRELLGDKIDERPERYSFTWAGRSDAIAILQKSTKATLKPDIVESVNFDSTGHTFIEGENLEVLKLLYKSYYGMIKMIYIDPPYNTGNDFIYTDNYAEPLDTYLKISGQKDSNGNLLTSNPNTNGKYHSKWLSMIYPRLFIARQLLREDGLIFLSIDDNEVCNLKMIMNEIFGEENFIGMFVWQSKKGGGSDSSTIVTDHEYIICYAKIIDQSSLSRIPINSEELNLKDEKGIYRRGRELNKWGTTSRREDRPTMYFPIPGPNGVDVFPIRNDGIEGRWRWGKKKMMEIVENGDVEFVERSDDTYIVYEKIRNTEPRYKPFRTWLNDSGTTADGSKIIKELFNDIKVYDFPKPVDLIKYLMSIGVNEQDEIILDFFAGSCTTAHAVLQVNFEQETNYKFICIQLPEKTPKNSIPHKAGYKTISEIAVKRIKKVIENLKREREESLSFTSPDFLEDLGFKYFKLTESNFRQWPELLPDKTTPEQWIEQMELFNDPLLDGWKVEDVIYEVALKQGYSLNSKIKKIEEIKDATVYQVVDADKNQSFYICLDETFKLETARLLKLKRDDFLICRDIALNDTTAANLSLQCKLKTI